MTFFDTLPTWLLAILAIIFGLTIGSFLNVVIIRLPVMLMRTWRAEAREALELPEETLPRFDLIAPRSQCPNCDTPIAWHDNVPLLGYFKRRGRCAHCAKPISLQYPLIELSAALLTLAMALLHGVSWASLALLAACLTLLVQAVIDLRTQLLPDILTLGLLWGGLLYQWLLFPDRLEDSVAGAIFGYGVLWIFYWLFKLLTGKEGMGHGDFKLLAALGAWLGWQALPLLLTLSAGLGAIIGLLIQISMPRMRGMPMAFGPYLVIAGWLLILQGEAVTRVYYQLLGLPLH
ncbi:prepilin peptidase [Phytohalomonas tamaricis]|uniref:prepilin peptidase n=1 Tax=Phytohalomonas tamaricis TaxID=2081032 RepID=UPI000D0B896D|nr:A24 family peptidase [Phytohalomonas tamaricis]